MTSHAKTSADRLSEMRAENERRSKLPVVYHANGNYRRGDVWRVPCGVDVLDKSGPVVNSTVMFGPKGQLVTCPGCVAAMREAP